MLLLSVSCSSSTIGPLRVVVDMMVGESCDVELADGSTVRVKLLGIDKACDELRGAIRSAAARVEVDGQAVTLAVANYNLPVAVAGVQIDCPVTGDYYSNCSKDWWGLEKDARLRLWPPGSPFIWPGTFVYPVRQRWFATDTQMGSEPCYVDGGEVPAVKEIGYHGPLDFGGAEGLDEVLTATDGLVVAAGDSVLTGYKHAPVEPRYDAVYILDNRGWFYRYWHLKSIEPAVRPGERVRMGRKIATLGKEGNSGGWAHLHFEIISRQPSGKWGNEEGYAYLWESYLSQYQPAVIAVARPHHLAAVGRTVTLDGRKSRSLNGRVVEYEWTFCDGGTASGPVQERIYERPGTYHEVLKVTDSQGSLDYDFAEVQVIDKSKPDQLPPTLHAACYPTLGIRPGAPVTFMVRTFNARSGNETWDFGDGSGPVTVKSHESFGWQYERYKDLSSRALELHPEGYARTVHTFSEPGHYIVTVERTGDFGYRAVERLHVEVQTQESR
ncbi:MAG: PKD domain-containing protein [Gemmatimonadota bacterium]|nr:PKD domain-containing protein [Gemmatimonadota bacterium]